MASREYFLGPTLGTTRKDVMTDIGNLDDGWLKSLLEARMLTILNNSNNLADDLIIKIKVIDA